MIILRSDCMICVTPAANIKLSAKAKNFSKYSCNIHFQYSTILLGHLGMTYLCSR